MESNKNTSSRKRLYQGRENGTSCTFDRTHPAIRQHMLHCFCSRPGKVWKTIKEPHLENCMRYFVTCAKEDNNKRCSYHQWINSSWIAEATITVTEDVSPRKVLAQM